MRALAAGAAGMGLIGWLHVPAHVSSGTLAEAAGFAAAFAGAPMWRHGAWPLDYSLPSPLLLFFAIVFSSLLLGTLWWSRRERSPFAEFHRFIVVWVVLLALAGSAARSGFGWQEGANKKYAPTALLAWASAASLLLARANRIEARRPKLLAGAAVTLALVLPGQWIEYRVWKWWSDRVHEAVRVTAAGVYDAAMLGRLYYDGRVAFSIIQELSAAGQLHGLEPVSGPCTGRAEGPADPRDYVIEFLNGVRYPQTVERPSVGARAPFTVSGWAVDGLARANAGGVAVEVDGVCRGASYGASRDDVRRHFGWPAADAAGFQFSLPAGVITPGEHSLRIRIGRAAGRSYTYSPEFRFRVLP
jgi:hypothetical protein